MTESERIILSKLDTLEEAMKMLLVNDVLKDAENLTGQKQDSVQLGALQKELDKLQETLKAKETEIKRLQSQLNAQRSRIQTLQELADSKDRTIQIKDNRIKSLEQSVRSKDDSVTQLQYQIRTLQQAIDNKDRILDNVGKSCRIAVGTMLVLKSGIGIIHADQNICAKPFKIIDFNGTSKYLIKREARNTIYTYWVSVDEVTII